MEDKALKVFIAEASSLSLSTSNHDKNQEAEKKSQHENLHTNGWREQKNEALEGIIIITLSFCIIIKHH